MRRHDSSIHLPVPALGRLQESSLLRWPLQILAIPYGAVVGMRNVFYDREWLRPRKLPCRVISVGNLTVGGTGKTPIVIWVAQRLIDQGRRVAVLSRGYRRTAGAPYVLVSNGASMLAGPHEAGDEPYLIAQRCPGTTVAVGADRYRLGRWVLEQCPVDDIILDDGFQHRRLYRDVDLLVLDASDRQGMRGLLPAGRLREPLSSAARAAALLVTRLDGGGDARAVVEPINAAAGRGFEAIEIRFKPEGLLDLGTGAVLKPEQASGRRAFVFSGIGNTASFRSLVRRCGIEIKDALAFEDHHIYTPDDLETIRARFVASHAEYVVTTEKDAVKLRPLMTPTDRIVALRLRTEIGAGRERLESLILPAEQKSDGTIARDRPS
jgi:tetraacyldisaccharide 4'-kinase